MKKIIVLSLFTLFCLSAYAQEASTIYSKDILKNKILEIFNNTKWNYYYSTNPQSLPKVTIIDSLFFKDDDLIFNFKELGNVSLNLIENSITTQLKTDDNPPRVRLLIGCSNEKEKCLIVWFPYQGKIHSAFDKKNEYANEQTLKLFELLKNYHDKNYYDEELVIQQAKELDDFTLIAQKYHASSDKPTLTEEQRKYIVQANAYNKAMNYQMALELYMTVAKINPTSYPEGYYNMALIAAEMKNYSFAIFNMKKYLILSPEASDARAAQDKIYEWELFIKK